MRKKLPHIPSPNGIAAVLPRPLVFAVLASMLAGTLAEERVAGAKKSPLIPMAAMTGKPARETIRHRLRQYAEVDVKQFLIYPRSGTEIPYMSEEWLEACRHVVECAEELDIDVWLYDEFNWPSGRCDGQVMEGHPEFCAKTLEGTKAGAGMSWKVTAIPDQADVLSPEAMRRFMALTHERYADVLGNHLGRRVKGIFTDEPSFVYGRPRAGDGVHLRLPYYDGLEADYQRRTGRDLRDDLGKAMHGGEIEGLWPAFYGLLGQRFQEAYFNPIREWCDRHGMVSTGHLMSETPPVSAIKASGTPLACLRSLSLPGIDEINTRTGFDNAEWGTLLLARHAAAARGSGGLAELFALGPPDLPFGTLRQMIWLTALHGVSEYVLAVSPLDVRGNLIKREYFTAFTPVQTWFEHLPMLAEDSARAAEIARAGFGPGVAVRYPWSLACEDAGREMLGGKSAPRSGRLHQAIKELIGGQWPVRILDEAAPPPEDAIATVTILPDAVSLSAPNTGDAELQTAEELAAWMEKNGKRPFRITGDLAPGNLLVEHLADGRICVLNLTDRDFTDLELRVKEREIRFDLPSRGARVFDPAKTGNDLPVRRESASPPRFEIRLDRANLMRCRFEPSAAKAHGFSFRCEKTVSVRLLLRSPDRIESVRLDGRPVATPADCVDLPEGMREFYKASGNLDLAPGEHHLELTGEVDDAPYLPAAFLAGDFGLFEGDVLGSLASTAGCEDLRACGLRNYSGKVTLYTRILVPDRSGAIGLCLATGEHIAEVVMDGRSLGVRAWAPFEWPVPGGFRGKEVSVEIVLTPSIAAMFDRPETVSGGSSWLKGFWPGQHAALGVLESPAWCFRE